MIICTAAFMASMKRFFRPPVRLRDAYFQKSLCCLSAFHSALASCQ